MKDETMTDGREPGRAAVSNLRARLVRKAETDVVVHTDTPGLTPRGRWRIDVEMALTGMRNAKEKSAVSHGAAKLYRKQAQDPNRPDIERRALRVLAEDSEERGTWWAVEAGRLHTRLKSLLDNPTTE